MSHRSNGSGCPYCSGLKVTKDKSLSSVYPEVALSWNIEKTSQLHMRYLLTLGRKFGGNAQRGMNGSLELQIERVDKIAHIVRDRELLSALKTEDQKDKEIYTGVQGAYGYKYYQKTYSNRT